MSSCTVSGNSGWAGGAGGAWVPAGGWAGHAGRRAGRRHGGGGFGWAVVGLDAWAARDGWCCWYALAGQPGYGIAGDGSV